VVKDLNASTPEGFLAAVAGSFSVSPSDNPVPSSPREYSMYITGRWYTIKPLEGTFDKNDPILGLDVSILQNNLLGPVLGIDDPRTSERIDFIGGIRGPEELVRLVDSGRFAVAFSMYPTTLDQLLSVADSGNVMPPKSTWFEPKLRSGLVVHSL
jgi:uncharacterized protein (DUF1015 family)